MSRQRRGGCAWLQGSPDDWTRTRRNAGARASSLPHALTPRIASDPRIPPSDDPDSPALAEVFGVGATLIEGPTVGLWALLAPRLRPDRGRDLEAAIPNRASRQAVLPEKLPVPLSAPAKPPHLSEQNDASLASMSRSVRTYKGPSPFWSRTPILTRHLVSAPRNRTGMRGPSSSRPSSSFGFFRTRR